MDQLGRLDKLQQEPIQQPHFSFHGSQGVSTSKVPTDILVPVSERIYCARHQHVTHRCQVQRAEFFPVAELFATIPSILQA